VPQRTKFELFKKPGEASNATALSAFHVSTAPNTGFNNNQGAERSGNKKIMVRPAGFEPATYGLEACF